MHAVNIHGAEEEKYSHTHARGLNKKGAFCQRLSVQLQLLAQRCCGRKGSSSATSKSRSTRSSEGGGSCWNKYVVLLLFLQAAFLFVILTQRSEIENLEHELGRASSAMNFYRPNMTNWNEAWQGVKAAIRTPGGATEAKTPPYPTRQRPEEVQQPVTPVSQPEAAEPWKQDPEAIEIVKPPLAVQQPSAAIVPASTSAQPANGMAWEWKVDSYDREYEIYTKLADEEEKITPEIVRKFRQGKVDWHNLLPDFKKSGHGELDFTRLVAGEVATTKYLTFDFNLHHFWNWGKDHGPLREYASCRKLYDKCNIHGKADCLNNGLCGWCESASLCIDRVGKPLPYDEHEHKTACPVSELLVGPQNQELQCRGGVALFEGGQMKMQDHTQGCKIVASDRWLNTALNPNAGAMYYHFLKEHFEPWYSQYYSGGKIQDRYTHVIVTSGSMDHFHDYYGIFTRLCPRYPHEVTDGTCFCTNVEKAAGTMEIPPEGKLPTTTRLVDAMVKNLGLEHIQPPEGRPALGLLSRENKRFILNELELARIAVEMGISIKLLPLEYMTIYEQIREFRRLHFLTGIHGSGLTNYFLLHNNPGDHHGGLDGLENGGSIKNSDLRSDASFARALAQKKHFVNYCLQILPHQVRIGGEGLRGFAQQINCEYEEWVQPKRKNTVLHTHFLNSREFQNLHQLMQQGPAVEDSAFFSFWVNQDSIIDPDDWRSLLRRMVEK